jgi:hypothetical protein
MILPTPEVSSGLISVHEDLTEATDTLETLMSRAPDAFKSQLSRLYSQIFQLGEDLSIIRSEMDEPIFASRIAGNPHALGFSVLARLEETATAMSALALTLKDHGIKNDLDALAKRIIKMQGPVSAAVGRLQQVAAIEPPPKERIALKISDLIDQARQRLEEVQNLFERLSRLVPHTYEARVLKEFYAAIEDLLLDFEPIAKELTQEPKEADIKQPLKDRLDYEEFN